MTPGHVRAARLAYIVVVLVATLTNLHLDSTWADVAPRLARALDFSPHMSDAIDAARNVLLFAGLGAVWIATSRLTRPGVTLLTLALVSFLLSASVETMQLFSPVREASVIDVMTDTMGGVFGGIVTLGAFAVINESAGKRSYLGFPAVIFAVGYGLATIMESFIPLFRQDLLPNLGGGIGDRIGRAIVAMRPESLMQIPLTDLFIFFPAGLFAAAALVEAGVSGAIAAFAVVCVGAILYPAVEVVHGVASEPIILGAALVHVVAAGAGALVAAWGLTPFSRRLPKRARARLVALGYSCVIMIWSWRPFRLDLSPQSMADQFTSDHLIPLQALASRGDLFSVTDVVAQGLIFFPLGALLAVWPVRRAGFLRGLMPAIYLALVLEAGKIPIADRFMDITHVLIQGAGAALGFLLVRRMGYKVQGELAHGR
jgi:VanZ family protein